ncbi:PREDICTED: insecticyanin-B-like [Papilio polytes]|uniref:Bilin-binding protein n=1 Tax=Papilio polytes TaxID=76194 RepID=A0A679FE98_PAPPL|nr:PREDICTED: insecticyanin-B-like [Papilio polytes]BBV14734.1 bilin-binding protein [Papilio polytes]
MYYLFVFTLIAAASAEVIYNGPCPDVQPKENFDFSAYQGTWYEMVRYPHAGEEGVKGKCTLIEYYVYGNNNGRVKKTHIVDGVQTYVEGDLSLSRPGTMMTTLTFGGVSKNAFITVLDTDYSNYAIAYNCKYFPDGDKHQVRSWIMSRTTRLDENSRALVNNYLNESIILDSNKYIGNDYSPAACQASVVKSLTDLQNQYY